MQKKTRRIVVIIVTAALLLSVLLPALTLLARADVTKKDIQNIKDELTDITAQKKEAEAKLAAIRSDLSKAKEQAALIQEQILLTEQEINASQAMLDAYDLQIADKEREIAELERREEEQYREFYQQVRWMEETGGVSYLSILFEANSFADMLDYTMLIGDIMDYSNRIIEELEATQAELDLARGALQADRDAQAAVQSELEGRLDELAALEAQQNANINMTSGDWYWPLPGRYKISSLFGNRADPFTGRRDNHTGTDIPAPGGTPIYAAKDGVVTTVDANRYASSYGYYCIISHGSGYATLYAHQNQVPIVKEGQTVKKGQVIGYVGSTGRSTGNHLHFEVRVNGSRRRKNQGRLTAERFPLPAGPDQTI